MRKKDAQVQETSTNFGTSRDDTVQVRSQDFRIALIEWQVQAQLQSDCKSFKDFRRSAEYQSFWTNHCIGFHSVLRASKTSCSHSELFTFHELSESYPSCPAASDGHSSLVLGPRTASQDSTILSWPDLISVSEMLPPCSLICQRANCWRAFDCSWRKKASKPSDSASTNRRHLCTEIPKVYQNRTWSPKLL